MNSFSNAMMQRHLGQAETVLPRPLGLYEPVRNTGIENLDQSEQNLTDTEQDVMSFPLPEAERLMKPPQVQTTYPLSANEWPRQEQGNLQTDSRPTAQKTLQIIPPLLTSAFQPPVQSIPSPVPSADTERSTSIDLDNHDFQQPKNEQIGQRHLFQTQIAHRIVTHVKPILNSDSAASNPLPVTSANLQGSTNNDLNSHDFQQPNPEQIAQQHLFQTQIEPIIKSDNVARIVQPATITINLGNQTQSNQSERFMVPPPEMNQIPAAPVIKISIGRIEVKAVVQTPSQPAKSSPAPKPRMSLDEYLKKQDNHSK